MEEINTKVIYRQRFDDTEFRKKMWQLLCVEYFQKYIPENSTLLEIAAGYCEFINNIKAGKKIVVDINEDTKKYANPDVKVYLGLSTNLSSIPSSSIDRIFISNFFEHIVREDIEKTLKECLRCLKKDGKILILQPNIRFAAKDYWMFWDHITPIDDRALCEIMTLIGFTIEKNIPSFLPFTTKSKLPKSLILLKIYLKIPLLNKFFGGQAFIIASK